MDFLNKTYAQLVDLFRSMTIGARITAGLLLVVVVISLLYLLKWHSAGPEVDLMHGLPVPAGQLPNMQAAFDKAGLSGYEIRGTQIRVPRGQEAKYMAALAEAKALPPNFGSAMKEAINAGNVFEGTKQKEQRFKIALQDELALIIGQMSGIENAYVLYDSDTRFGLNREKITTASVSIKPVGSTQLDEARVSSIRHLVAGAIAGLKPESVTVADLNGRVYHGSPDGGGSAEENLYLTLKRIHEQDLKNKILNSLCYIPNVTVEPSVVLDPERIRHSKKIQRDPKTVPVREVEKNSTKTQEGAGPAGRPGLESQQPNRGATLTARSSGSRQEGEDSTRETISLASGEEVEKETLGLTPKRVTVSVGIPSSYFEKVWRERNPSEEGSEPKKPDQAALDAIRQEESVKIQKHVAALLPPVEGLSDLAELVTVTTFQDIRAPKLPEPPATEHALGWLGQYWPTLGMIGLALFSLVMLRSMVRSAPPATPTTSFPVLYAKESAEPEEEPAHTAAQKRLRRFQGGGKSLRDELSDLVHEDPDVAANILKSWIGHAG